MRFSAHKLSASFNIDPLPKQISQKPKVAQADWIYWPGDYESYQLLRMRKESHRECANVFHPGLFRTFSHHLFFRKVFELTDAPKVARGFFCHSGDISLSCNGVRLSHQEGQNSPFRTRVSLRSVLKKGTNHISLTVTRIEEPPSFLLDCSVCPTDATWEVSSDGFHFRPVASFPWMERRLFPHRQRLPRSIVAPRNAHGNLYDFGIELLGYPVVRTKTRAGQLWIHPGESLPEVHNNVPAFREQPVNALAIPRNGIVRGPKTAMRYLRIESTPRTEIQKVFCEVEFRPAIYRGAFACSDDKLTRIWQHSAYTLRLCMREFFVDGLKRDRLPWVGDLYVAIAANAFSFADIHVVRATLTALAPEKPRNCHVNGILDYTLYWLLSLQLYHLHFDDLAYLRQSWPVVEEILAVLDDLEDKNGFLRASKDDWVFVDWAEIDKRGIVATLQMLYAMALDAMANLAGHLGGQSRSLRLTAKARRLRKNCRRAFWNEKKGAFVSNLLGSRQGSQVTRHANFFAILSGVATARQASVLHRNVLSNKTIPAVGTPYMHFFENLALARMGAVDEMLDHIRDYWGGMLDKGATTFWEAYDPSKSDVDNLAFYGRPFANSQCHAWAAGPVYLLSSELWGLHITEPGWREMRHNPSQSALAWACATWPTPHGDASVQLANGRTRLRLPKGIKIVHTVLPIQSKP